MRHSSMWTWPARCIVLIATVASVLVPAWASPSRTISVPRTQAMSVQFPGLHRSGFTSGLQRFALAPTHVAFVWTGSDGSAIHYRSLTRAGLSRWHLAPEADDLRHGDMHYSGVLAVEGVTALQWRASLPQGAAMGAVTLEYMNTLNGPRVSERIPALAGASPTTPDIVTRAEWGADESMKRTTGGCERHFFPVQQLFVHHTAGTNFDPHPKATMRAILYFHTKIRGWCDIGYNFVVGPNGTIYEGRWARDYSPWETHTSESRSGLGVMGAHVRSYNAGSIGISVMGNYSLIRLPDAMRQSLAGLLAWESDRHHLRPLHWHTYRSPDSGLRRWLPYVAGHRDAGATACPGNYLYAALTHIRRETVAAIGKGRGDSSIVLDGSSGTVTFGQGLTVAGRVTKRSGNGVSFAHVRLYTRRSHHFWHERRLRTRANGGFSIRLAPSSKMRVRAVYHGDRKRWGSQSGRETILVAPKIGLTPEGGVADGSGVIHYPAGTLSVGLSGVVAPAHPGLSVRVRVLRDGTEGTTTRLASVWTRLDEAGNFGIDFRVPQPGTGTYSGVAKFPSDGDHTTARSERVFFTIDPAV